MLCSAIITSVATQTGVISTDIDYFRLINDAVNFASLEAKAKSDVFGPLALTNAIDSYDTTAAPFPSDWIRARYITVTSATYGITAMPMKPVSISKLLEYRQTPLVGVPPRVFATIGRNRLLIAPAAVTGDTISGVYIQRPTQVTVGGDTPDLPQEYHESIIENFVLAKVIQIDDRDAGNGEVYMQKAVAAIARLARDVVDEAGDDPMQMERVSGNGVMLSRRPDLDRGW